MAWILPVNRWWIHLVGEPRTRIPWRRLAPRTLLSIACFPVHFGPCSDLRPERKRLLHRHNLLHSSLSSGFPHASMFMSISIDGGHTFTTHRIFDVTELPRSLPGNSFRTFTIPQLASDGNGVYLIWDDYGLGNSNVMFSKSTDGGNTWSTPIRVNDVITGQHFFSSIAASGGTISIVWYDSRNGQQPNGTITGLHVYYAESTNIGAR